jgi:transcriptional regulator with XRE-family HTH domain
MPRDRVTDSPEEWRQLGMRLTEAMDAVEMDPEELSSRTGFSVAQIERWRTGRSIIYCSQLLLVCSVLGITSTALFARDKRRLQ